MVPAEVGAAAQAASAPGMGPTGLGLGVERVGLLQALSAVGLQNMADV